jgi:hypothetical protein
MGQEYWNPLCSFVDDKISHLVNACIALKKRRAFAGDHFRISFQTAKHADQARALL